MSAVPYTQAGAFMYHKMMHEYSLGHDQVLGFVDPKCRQFVFNGEAVFEFQGVTQSSDPTGAPRWEQAEVMDDFWWSNASGKPEVGRLLTGGIRTGTTDTGKLYFFGPAMELYEVKDGRISPSTALYTLYEENCPHANLPV